MGDSVSDLVSWSELVSSAPLSDRQMIAAAHKRFSRSVFRASQTQAKRSFIQRLIELAFDPNVSLLDTAEQLFAIVRSHGEAGALKNCSNYMIKLSECGWYKREYAASDFIISTNGINVKVVPHALLAKDNEEILLYAYFRKSPPLCTNAVRVLLCFLKHFVRSDIIENRKILVLDCYKDRAYSSDDFSAEERWIKLQLGKALQFYSDAYLHQVDSGDDFGSSAGNNSEKRLALARKDAPQLETNQLILV
ncbi:hypothetical protein HL658_03720 [Azospirillum sp. RWY-5-1]|uniref:Uncharacterized protein n=1 Tax=Azospirillum oleiclasticum TaxID=2735135 RepID=A0ABX2T3Z8_9PROT|nr:hypothetical protein [Azospirillum oleiclasticum]NYZ11646.1 hypothetical protein [Azospirillum oleiclasticum]NYZ18807.1 hypothetical protein [Azospirillum oleiclasticum]